MMSFYSYIDNIYACLPQTPFIIAKPDLVGWLIIAYDVDYLVFPVLLSHFVNVLKG